MGKRSEVLIKSMFCILLVNKYGGRKVGMFNLAFIKGGVLYLLCAGACVCAWAMPPASDYERHDIYGWQVMISPNVKKDEALYQPILSQLWLDLEMVNDAIPESSLGFLKETTIWVEQGMPIAALNRTFFNGGRAITKKNGLVPESYGGVIIGNTKGYLAVTGIHPWQMLHELTHAFHQFNLRHNYPPIKQAYQDAMSSKRFHNESDERIRGKAYATKNHKEYFSVLSEIYFGEKKFFPHNRKELAEHDPVGYCAVVKAWGLLGKQQGDSVPLVCSVESAK